VNRLATLVRAWLIVYTAVLVMILFARSVAARFPLALAVCLVAAGCGKHSTSQPLTPAVKESQPAWFTDATAEMRLDFTHDPGPINDDYLMAQINGSGAAFFDSDNDGRLDIYLLQFGGPKSTSTNALFRQMPDGKFQNVSQGSGLDINGYNAGVAVGDVNNDGWLDVVVTQYVGVKFFLNQGSGIFADATEQSGLVNPYWGTSASFVDYDRDGWLDLVIVNYLVLDESRRCTARGGLPDYCVPSHFPGTPSRLWRNRGKDDAGKWLGYEDRTEASGLGKAPGPGLGVVCADLNGDRWPDLFIANDAKANHLWINQKDGTFREEAAVRGVAYNANGESQSNMGVAYGDVDGDGLSDLFVTHFFDEHHALWRQELAGMFREQAVAAGLTRPLWHGTGWGTVFSDFDQDGDLDLSIANGLAIRREPQTGRSWTAYMERNQVFSNDGAGHFRDLSNDNPALCHQPNVGRGLCVGDLDGDGGLDLLVTQVGGPARIFRNVAQKRGHWLMVRALDPALHRDAIGADIRLSAGKRRWQRLIQPGQSFQCSNDLRAHFGLGDEKQVESIEVLWPDGRLERFLCSKVDCVVEVQRGKGQPVVAATESRP
jgi:hypothetical protein